MVFPKVDILGVKVASLTMEEAVAQAETYMKERAGAIIATANAEMIMRAVKDEELRRILNTVALVVPDGAGTVWAARYLGCVMPERVAGFDLVQELLRRAPARQQRVFFLGAAPGIAEAAKNKAEGLYPGISIVGTRDGYFTPEEEPAIVTAIQDANPDLLLVALGVPRQEKWLAKYRKAIGVPLSIGVGGTFDVMAGMVKRAPRWMQRSRLEWLYRGFAQPQRIGRLMALPQFVWRVRSAKKQ